MLSNYILSKNTLYIFFSFKTDIYYSLLKLNDTELVNKLNIKNCDYYNKSFTKIFLILNNNYVRVIKKELL